MKFKIPLPASDSRLLLLQTWTTTPGWFGPLQKKFIYFSFMCKSVLPECMNVHCVCVCLVPTEVIGTGFQSAVGHPVGAGN